MPRPYSVDLRERVLLACERDDCSHAEIARRFTLAESTVSTWYQAWRDSGRRTAKPPGRGLAALLTAAEEAMLRQLVAEDNAATRQQYCDRLAERCDVKVSVTTLGQTLQRLGLTRKKRPCGRANKTAKT
jgi:transposase